MQFHGVSGGNKPEPCLGTPALVSITSLPMVFVGAIDDAEVSSGMDRCQLHKGTRLACEAVTPLILPTPLIPAITAIQDPANLVNSTSQGSLARYGHSHASSECPEGS